MSERRTSTSKRVVIIGVGNELLSDEGLGVHVVRALRKTQLPSDVSLLEVGTRGLELRDAGEGFEKLVIVDVVRSGVLPGTIGRWQVAKDVDEAAPSMVSLHEMDLMMVLKIGRATGKLPDDVIIIGIEPKTLERGVELSPELKVKLPDLVSMVLKEVSATDADG